MTFYGSGFDGLYVAMVGVGVMAYYYGYSYLIAIPVAIVVNAAPGRAIRPGEGLFS